MPRCLYFISYFNFNRRLGTWLLNVMWIYSVGNASLHIFSEPGREVSRDFTPDVIARVVKSGVRIFIPAPLVKLVWSWKCAKYSFFRSAGRAYWTSQTPRYICDWIWASLGLDFAYFPIFYTISSLFMGKLWLCVTFRYPNLGLTKWFYSPRLSNILSEETPKFG